MFVSVGKNFLFVSHYIVDADRTVFGQGLLRLGKIGLSRPGLEFSWSYIPLLKL
mgnify:CR=1 FL=1